MTTYKDLTDYPKIFTRYWGNFEVCSEDNNNIELKNIIFNRNSFVKEFDIIKFMLLPKYIDRREKLENIYCYNNYYDHTESYYTKNNEYIIIISPYLTLEREDYPEYIKFYENKGFKIYKPLYSCDTITFIKVITK